MTWKPAERKSWLWIHAQSSCERMSTKTLALCKTSLLYGCTATRRVSPLTHARLSTRVHQFQTTSRTDNNLANRCQAIEKKMDNDYKFYNEKVEQASKNTFVVAVVLLFAS